MFAFATYNEILADVLENKGVMAPFYIASGSIFCSVVYNVYMIIKMPPGSKCWLNQNIIVGGKLQTRNLIYYLLYSTIYATIKIAVVATFFYS